MEEIKNHRPGSFCWADVAAENAEEAKKFYTDIFGWDTFDEPTETGMIYTMFMVNGKPVAALYELNDQMKELNIPPHWMPYVCVEDADETVKKAKEAGGRVDMDPLDVMEYGRSAYINDPEGGMLSVWQPKKHIGASYLYGPGAISWNEFASHDPEKSTPFYEKLFDWKAKSDKMGDMDYTSFFMDDFMAAGLYKLPDEMRELPPHWLTYFGIEEIDKALQKVQDHGGTILMPKTPVPDIGDVAVIRDPQGAVFGLWQKTDQ